VNIPVLELAKNREATLARTKEESLKSIEKDNADVIILGCMSMAFMEIAKEIQESCGVPVVNPALLSLEVLEGLIQGGLSHSKRAFPIPKKVSAF
jgi:allantoin racemase